ncbi:MAG: type II secretion system protein [Armatimonadetes bacterium]|nr:type II secretion system protein [Armatimonadota bacterium]
MDPHAHAVRTLRGFSLIEVVITMLLLSMVMTMVSLLLQGSAQVVNFAEAVERTGQAAQLGLERITSELREATEIKSTGGTLVFEKVDPTRSFDSSNIPDVPGPLPDGWTPPGWTRYPAAAYLTVTYRSDGTQLVRRVGSVRQVIAEGITGFDSRQPETGVIRLSLTMQERRRTRTLETLVTCPVVVGP